MTIGARIKHARLMAGFSQRQLCGEVVTRNMLSLIESGKARPSMETLRYFAKQLGKPMSYFLEEEAVISPNQQVMDQAEKALEEEDYAAVLEILEGYRAPDGLFDGRKAAVEQTAALQLAKVVAAQGKKPYALNLLERAGNSREAVLLRYWLQAGSARELVSMLPPITEELLLRAQGALESGKGGVAAAYLDACEEKPERWYLLRGRAYMSAGAFSAAAAELRKVEEVFREQTLPLLERCYKEMGDYQKAYEYACKRREE